MTSPNRLFPLSPIAALAAAVWSLPIVAGCGKGAAPASSPGGTGGAGGDSVEVGGVDAAATPGADGRGVDGAPTQGGDTGGADSPAPPDGGDNGTSLTRESFAAMYCDLFAPCCAMVKKATGGKYCRSLLDPFPGFTVDAAAARACLAEARALVAQPDGCATLARIYDRSMGYNQPWQTCYPLLQRAGTTPPGGRCRWEEDCTHSSEGSVVCRDIVEGTAEDRHCQIVARGVEGSKPCVGDPTGDPTPGARVYWCGFDDDLRCDWATKACVKLPAAGQACAPNEPQCTKSASCDQTTHLCVARNPLGGACKGGPSGDRLCAEGSFCHEGSDTCTTLRANGAFCIRSAECQGRSCNAGQCENSYNGTLRLVCDNP